MAGIVKSILVGVTSIALGGVTSDYVAKPLVETVKPRITALLRNAVTPPSEPGFAPPPKPIPPAKPRPTSKPERAVPVVAPKLSAPVAEPASPPARSEPLPKAAAPESTDPPKARPPKPRPAPRAVPPSPHEQDGPENPDACAGGEERWREHWRDQGTHQDSDPLPAREGERWSAGRDDPRDYGRWSDPSEERLARRPQTPPPAPATVPPDGWPVFCGFERPCSQRRARKPEWRLW